MADPKNIKILLVDDEEDILDMIEYNLTREGYQVFKAQNGKEGVQKALEVEPNLILLDVMMPEMDGVEACQEIRSNNRLDDTIIAFLTARGEDYSQIVGFDSGADDYISKPIKPKVLLSRIKGLLRRVKDDNNEAILDLLGLQINRDRYMIEKDGEEITLPKKEFELLALLVSKPGNVFTRETILDRVWGKDIVVGDRTIDVHIRKLREKIGESFIKTIKGVGYKVDTPTP